MKRETAGQAEVAVLADTLGLCSAGGSPLLRLDVSADVELQQLASWLPALPALRQLRLHSAPSCGWLRASASWRR